MNLTISLPSPPRQRLIAAVMAHLSEARAKRAESRTVLNALLPAILDRAFAGTL